MQNTFLLALDIEVHVSEDDIDKLKNLEIRIKFKLSI